MSASEDGEKVEETVKPAGNQQPKNPLARGRQSSGVCCSLKVKGIPGNNQITRLWDGIASGTLAEVFGSGFERAQKYAGLDRYPVLNQYLTIRGRTGRRCITMTYCCLNRLANMVIYLVIACISFWYMGLSRFSKPRTTTKGDFLKLQKTSIIA
jgi:hypothetical protein